MHLKFAFYPTWRWGSYIDHLEASEFIMDDFGNLIEMDTLMLIQNMHSMPITQSIY